MSDQQISCSDCGDVFLFSDAEQTFYREKGLAAPPKRCKACRAARKASGPHAGAPGAGRGAPRRGPGGGGGDRTSNDPNGYRSPMSMGSWGGQGQERGRGAAPARGGDARGQFAPRGGGDRRPSAGGPRNDRPRGNGGFGGGGFGGGGGGGAPYRSPAFPEARSEGRPAARGNGGSSPLRARAERPERPKFDITCVTCGVQAQVPFKPIEGREVFCKTCYQARRGEPRPVDATLDADDTDRGIVE